MGGGEVDQTFDEPWNHLYEKKGWHGGVTGNIVIETNR